MMVTRGLTKRYGKGDAVDGLSFTIRVRGLDRFNSRTALIKQGARL
jgi:hypothetical protein